jgi:hypothetical protein
MNKNMAVAGGWPDTGMRSEPRRTAAVLAESTNTSPHPAPSAVPVDALDDRIAIVGTAGSGKTYAAKGFVERLLNIGARVTIVDPLGVWVGIARERRRQRCRLSGRGVRRASRRCADHRRDGRCAWPDDRP